MYSDSYQFAAPEYETPQDQNTEQKPAPERSNKSYMDVLKQYEYGPDGLLKAEDELKGMGIGIQKDSAGRARGRIKLANGDIVDVVASGEGNDWWGNKTGTSWGNLNRGQEGLDAGGWSFGGSSTGGSLIGNLMGDEKFGLEAGAMPQTTATGAGDQSPAVAAAGGGGLPAGARYMDGQDPNNPNALVILANGQVLPKSHPMFQAATGQTPGAGTPGTTTGPESDEDALARILRERMEQDPNVDPNDPLIKNQVDSFAAQTDRDRNQYLNEMAERASAQGLGESGLVDTERRMASERSGMAKGKFQAELVGRELQARRAEIQHALDSMGARLTEQERQALQRELAEADNALRRYGIDTQNSQFFAGLSQADRHFLQQLAQQGGQFRDQLGFNYAQLGQQGSQFLDQLGFNMADREAYWDSLRRGL